MNQSQRRATALTNEQIAYIKGCARLQLSVWRLCHRDPLMALSDRVSKMILKKAVLILIETRQRLRRIYLRSYLQKWLKLAQMMTLSNSKRQALLRGRVNRMEALKRFILSQSLKNWRIKAARSVEDYLGRMGAFMKLMEAGLKKKTKPVKKEFFQNMKKTISPEFSRKPLKAVINVYDKCQRLLKSRAMNSWRNKVRDLLMLVMKRNLMLKNIVKPMVANDTAVLKNSLKKWKHNALGLRNDYEKMLLLRGHSAYSLYNKWNKTNMIKILSTAFNDWRRRAAMKPINYKAKILEAKPHMLKHNINMNAEDLITGLRTRYSYKLRRDLLKRIFNRLNKHKKALLSKAFQKWSNKSDIMSLLKSKLYSLLRAQVNKKDLIRKMILKNTLKNWLLRTKSSESDILTRYGAMLKVVDLLTKTALKETKNNFLENMRQQRNPNYFKKPLRQLLNLYKKCEQRVKRNTLNNWHDTTKNLRNVLLRRTQLLKNRIKPLEQNRKDVLRRVLNKWNSTAKDIRNFNTFDGFIKGNSIYSIYDKWNKFNRANILSSAFNEWRRRAAVKPVDFRKILMEAKPHVLKHNINKNAEDLLNALRSKYYFANRQNKLRKVIKKGDKIKDFVLRNALRKWYTNTLKSGKNVNILAKLLINNDFRMNNLIEKLLRKSLYTWLKNVSQPKTSIPNTEKACDLIRKATTEPFFTKLREKMQKKMNKDRFISIIKLVLGYQDKGLLRWYFGQWRTTTRKLRAYDMNAIFLNQFFKNRQVTDKCKLFLNLKDRANYMNNHRDLTNRILTNIFTKIDALNNLYNREMLGKFLYKWKANCGQMRNPFNLSASYLEGFKTLENYCHRTTHPDVIKAYYSRLIKPAQHKQLVRLLRKYNIIAVNDSLRHAMNTWKENIKDRGELKKLRGIFDDYTAYNRQKLMSPYKDLCQAIVDFANKRNSKTGVITDFLRGLKDLPNQLRSMKRTHLLLKIINKENRGYDERLRSCVMEWMRRARCIKQESCSEIIQKFIRDKLQKRLVVKDKVEKGAEHLRLYIIQKVLDRLADYAGRNVLKDILLKYFNNKDANNMKVLKDKFNKWNSLLPYLRRDDAATLIQSWFRGALVRDDLNKYNRLNYLLLRIVSRYKSDPAPYFHKWCKNARLLKALDMDLIIQNFIRKNLTNRLKGKATSSLQDIFRKFVHKKIAEVLKEVGKFNPDDYDKFERILMNALRRQPYEKLKQGLRWSGILRGIKFAPELFDKFRKMHLRTYLERWLENGYLIPNSAATLIQAVYRGYKYRQLLNNKRTLDQILKDILSIYGMKKEDFLHSALLKWLKTVRKMKCNEDADLIRDFCRMIREKCIVDVQNKWKYLSHRLLPHQINNIFKLAKMNRVLDKIHKRNFLNKFGDYAFQRYISDLLLNLISRYDNNNKNELLRRRLEHWLKQVNREKQYEQSMADKIKNEWRKFHRNKIKLDKMKLKMLLQRFIGRILSYSELSVPAAFHKWAKNTRLLRCKESGTIIQDFCKDIREAIKNMAYQKVVKKIGEGLDILDSVPFGLRWAFDKLKEDNKRKGLYNFALLLQDKINDRRREVLNQWDEYIKNNLLSKLFPFRKYFMDKILRMKLKQWKETADEMKRLDDLESDRVNKIIELLKILIDRYDDDKMAVLRRNLKRWRDNAYDITKTAISKRIASFLTNKYKTGKARNNWCDLAGKLRMTKYSGETRDLIRNIKKLVGLQTFINDISGKIKEDGLNQLKQGNTWLRVIDVLKGFMGFQDTRNKKKALQRYLNRWRNTVERLNNRDNKLADAFDNINKRLLIDNANNFSDICIVKKLNDAIPVARCRDFFKKAKALSEKWDELIKNQGDKLSDLFDRLLKNYGAILKRKVVQWRDRAKKITKQTAENRIAQFIANKYKTSIARDHWQRLSKSLDTYSSNKDLYKLLRELKKRIALQSMAKAIDDAFKKPALDQLKDGADYIGLINFLQRLFGDWENRNTIATLHHMVKRWRDKVSKIRQRDEKITKALDVLDKKLLTTNVEHMADVFLVKKFTETIPAARAAEFFKTIFTKAQRIRGINDQQVQKIKRFMLRKIRFYEDFNKRKLNQWRDNAKKITEEANKRKIARFTENKYKTKLARDNWNKLVEKYDLYVNNRLLYNVRSRLRNWLRLKDMMEKLRNEFTKVGNDQLKEGAKFKHTLAFMKGLFDNWEERNKYLIKRFYVRRWTDKVEKLRKRDKALEEAMKQIDKKYLTNTVTSLADISEITKVVKAVPVARAKDFFSNLRRIWGDWDKIRKRILDLLSKYLESEEEKRINYLRRKLLQWKQNTKSSRKDVAKSRVARWVADKYKIAVARNNWHNLANKYDMFVNKTLLYQVKSRLRNWLKLRDLAEKLRHRFTKVGVEQLKEGIEFKKILVLMRTLFENWEERNKFLAASKKNERKRC